MSRKSFIAGNWKMNGLKQDAKEKIINLKQLLQDYDAKNVDVVICPPFTLVGNAIEHAEDSNIKIGAQDCHFNSKGAHTGDISPLMLKDLGCEYVILGHSERRTDHKESNEIVKNKAKLAIESGLQVILCIGETKEEKEQGKTILIVEKQLQDSLPENFDCHNTIIAYEPIWAIGTGLVPTLEDIQEVHSKIRGIVSNIKHKDTSDKIRILYGGSLNAKNAKEILSLDDVDGGLIGGASLIPEDFFTIISNAKK